MIERISQLILKQRLFVILASLFIVICAAANLDQTKFSSDYRIYFSDDNPHLKAYEDLQATFTKSDNVMFVLAPKDGQVFSAKTLSIVEQLTEMAWQLPYSIRVDSITNYQHTIAEDDDLLVDDLVANAMKRTLPELQTARDIALNEPSLAGRLIAYPNADVTAVNVSLELPGTDPSAETPEVANAAYEIQALLKEQYKDIDLYVTGQIITDNAFKDAAIFDLTHIVPLAFLFAVLAITLYILIASGSLVSVFSGTVSIILVIVCSILFAQGIAAWFHIDVTAASANAPTMILTLAIADSIHILASFFQQMQTGKTKYQAISESLRINQQPVFLTSITTVIGFLSLNFSDSPPFRDLGNIVAVGVLGAWFFSIVLLPALIMTLPFKVKNLQQQENSWTSSLANFVVRYSRKILVTSMLLMTSCILFLPQNELNDVWVEYFDTSMRQRQSADFTRERLTGLGNISFIVSAKPGSKITDPAYLEGLEKAANWLREQPEIQHVLTFSDVMKRLNKNLYGDAPEQYKLPDNAELAAQYLLLYEMSLPFGLDLNNQVDITKTKTRLLGSLAKTSTAELLELQHRASDWFAANVPNLSFSHGASSDVMFAHIGQSNIKSMLQGTLIALVLISIVLGFSLKSAYYGALSLLPNILPALVAFGIWGMSVAQIGLGLSVVFGMTLGIVVDYTVHFLSKFLRAKHENHLSTEDAIRYAFSTVGVALLVTTFILFANFSVLAISDFSMNADMGLMTAVTIVVALLVDFFFLPPLLLFLVGNHKQRRYNKTLLKPERNYAKSKHL
ncbi:MAG: efflux RND transporter permease subunit [Oleiphilus sp.]